MGALLRICSLNLTISATDDNKVEWKANRMIGLDCAILAATRYGPHVIVSTDEGYTTTKGTVLTILHVNSNQRHTAELTSDSAITPSTPYGTIIIVQNNTVFGCHTSKVI